MSRSDVGRDPGGGKRLGERFAGGRVRVVAGGTCSIVENDNGAHEVSIADRMNG
jgi:hypothetical protein